MRWKASTQYGTERASTSRRIAIYAAAREAQQQGTEGSLLVTVRLARLKRIVPIEVSASEAHRQLEWLDSLDDETRTDLHSDAPSLADALTSTMTEWLAERGIESTFEEVDPENIRVLVTECGTVTELDRPEIYGTNPCARARSLSVS